MHHLLPGKPEACQILFQVATFLKRGTIGAPWRGNHLGFSPVSSKFPTLLTSRSVVINTLLEPERNSLMITSRSFWSMSPCYNRKQKSVDILVLRTGYKWANDSYTLLVNKGGGLTMAETVKSLACIFSVSQSTFLRVLIKMTAWVMVRVSYKSHNVSSFHSWG